MGQGALVQVTKRYKGSVIAKSFPPSNPPLGKYHFSVYYTVQYYYYLC